MDTTGLDVSRVVMESIYEQFYQEPRFKPQAFIRNRMAAGLFGRKVDQGFYQYKENKKVPVSEPPAPTELPETVWVGPPENEGTSILAAFLGQYVEVEGGTKPSAKAICMVTPLGRDTTTTAVELGIEAERTVGGDT